MARRKPKFIIALQCSNGGTPKVSFEIAENKAQRIIDIIQSDMEKSIKKKKCTSTTLEPFFTDVINTSNPIHQN